MACLMHLRTTRVLSCDILDGQLSDLYTLDSIDVDRWQTTALELARTSKKRQYLCNGATHLRRALGFPLTCIKGNGSRVRGSPPTTWYRISYPCTNLRSRYCGLLGGPSLIFGGLHYSFGLTRQRSVHCLDNLYT